MNQVLCAGVIAVSLLSGVVVAKEEAAVPAELLKAFEGRFEKVRAEYAKWSEEFEKEIEEADDALKVGLIRKQSKPTQVAYLRFVMMLEEDFWLLSNPKDEVDDDSTPSLNRHPS